MFLQGKGVLPSRTEAMKWLQKSAHQGNAVAQDYIGHMYLQGVGVKQNTAIAVDWFRQAAENGHIDAQYKLGSLYYLGEGIERDYRQAATWLRAAARQHHVYASNDLAWLLATCPDKRIRDGEESIRLAEWVVNSSSGDFRYIGTLAAAYAESGRFNDAVKTQTEAIEIMQEDDPLYKEFRDQLESYKENQAWREE